VCVCVCVCVCVVHVCIYILIKHSLPDGLVTKIQSEISAMTVNGSPMNWTLAYGVAHATITEAGHGALIGKGRGKISLSRSWLIEMMHAYNLTPRMAGTDAQALPINWEQLGKVIFF